ncbi:MAG: hypothetical protein B6U69_01280 [Thermofilum sp. ex4484_15]|nr:MAG: hypothetical protein B6U69_01280 [Thermofilum sp. ex4484_15]
MKELSIRISERAYKALEEYAKLKKLSLSDALEVLLAELREGMLMEKYLSLIRKLDEVLRAHPSSVGSMYLEAYVNELRKVKEEIKAGKLYVLAHLDEVVISKETLRNCSGLLIRDCRKVVFKEDVSKEDLRGKIVRLINVGKLVAPKEVREAVE